MKTYNEMAESVFERKEEYEKNQKIKRKKLAKLTASFACVALAVAIGAGMWQVYNSPKLEQAEDEPTVNSAEDNITYPTEQSTEQSTEYTESSIANIADNIANDVFNATESQPKKVLVESFDGEENNSAAYSYKAPDPGEWFFSYGLNEALKKYGDTAIYRVRVDVFSDEGKITDRAEIEKVAEILIEKDCTVALEYTDGDCCLTDLTLHATESQLENFEADDEYGYFFFLYNDMR